MIARLSRVVLWLLAGHAIVGGLYWLLLVVPESNLFAVFASGILGLLIVFTVGIVETTAVLLAAPPWTLAGALRRSLAALPAFLVAALVWLGVSWICGWLESAHDNRSGEITAWFIATFDWTNTGWVHRVIRQTLAVIRYVIGSSLAVSVLATGAAVSFAAVLRGRWIRPALRPARLAAVAVAAFGLIWLPWRWIYWRPGSLPASSAEIAFVGVKLTIILLLMHLGLAVLYWLARGPSIEAIETIDRPDDSARPDDNDRPKGMS